MFCKYILLLLFCILKQSRPYVLLQISKDDHNRSNVDALIHKVVPSIEIDKLAKDLARKQLSIPKNRKPVFKSSNRDSKLDRESKLDIWDIKKAAVKYVRELFLDTVLRTNLIDFKPKRVNFKSGNPSLVYEINSDTVINAVKSLLTSRILQDYTDKMAEKAAVVLRSFNDGY